MSYTSFRGLNCSIARSLEVVGEWWTLLIIRDALRGTTQFDDFQASLNIARNVLSARLRRLVEHGVLERRRYQTRPTRYEYLLTVKGRALFPVVAALMHWGDTWESDRPPVQLVHDDCGHPAHAVEVCSHCGGALTDQNTRAVPALESAVPTPA